jgi:hypothetical protein
LGSQIVGDDEWHGIAASLNSFRTIVSQFQEADNCIPLTIVNRVILKTLSLNETGIRMVPLVSGLIALVLFPWLVNRLCGRLAGVLSMALVSASPLLVHYSRYSRPYMVVALASAVAFSAFHLWLERRQTIFAILYACAAVLAGYFSLVALPAVSAPALYITFKYVAMRTRREQGTADLKIAGRHIGIAAGIILIGSGLIILPALSTLGAVTVKIGRSYVAISSLDGAAVLFAGLPRVFALLTMVLAVHGWILLRRRHRFLADAFVFSAALQFAALFVSGPKDIQAAPVLARYAISLWILWLIFVSIALADIVERSLTIARRLWTVRAAIHMTPIILFISLVWVGPLPYAYSVTNDFTNHRDYQFEIRQRRIRAVERKAEALFPEFYHRLAADSEAKAVIEFPLITSWSLIPYHYYQRLHQKRVLVGRDEVSYIAQGFPVTHNLLRLKNFVSLENPEMVRSSGASFVIVHKDLRFEMTRIYSALPELRWFVQAALQDPKHPYQTWYFRPADEMARRALSYLEISFGPAVYLDAYIAVFEIRPDAKNADGSERNLSSKYSDPSGPYIDPIRSKFKDNPSRYRTTRRE